jgi:hypothetical protein
MDKKSLMAINIHIAASHLTQHGFSSAVTAAVAVGMKVNLDMSALIGEGLAVHLQLLEFMESFRKQQIAPTG